MNRAHHPHRTSVVRRGLAAFAVLSTLLAAAGCAEGENANASGGSGDSADAVTLDFATYNPLSLVVKDQG
jgi:sulfonate transport system substrate-binding protein